jgi:hypothetical protein
VGVAESGIEAGFAKVKHNVGGTWVNLTTKEWGADMVTKVGAADKTLLSGSVSYGNYTVTVAAHSMVSGFPSAVLMTSTGSYNGAQRVVEVVMEMKPGGPSTQYAILTGKDIYKISGNPVISGPYADVHTNRDIWISGNPIIAGSVTASGQVREGAGEPGVLDGVTGGAAPAPIPHIYPPTYKPYRHVRFSKDCKVFLLNRTTGVETEQAMSGGKWNGWDCSSGDKWTMGSSTSSEMYHGIIYVEGNVVISGSPTASIWYTSIIAEGYIEVSGNPLIRPWGSKVGNDTGNAVADEILFYAGGDLKINGNASQNFFGLMATHMELDVSGNPYLEGALIAENGAAQEVLTGQTAKNIADYNSFSGDMHLEAVGSSIFAPSKELKVTAWRELVN